MVTAVLGSSLRRLARARSVLIERSGTGAEAQNLEGNGVVSREKVVTTSVTKKTMTTSSK